MEQRRVITIDNGGSELRYIRNSENEEVNILSKEISLIDKENFRVKDNVDTFDVIEIKSAPDKSCEGMYVMGRGYYMYQGIDISMNNQKQKSNNKSWYTQVILAVATDAIKAALSNSNKVTLIGEEEEVNNIKEYSADYILTTLIPVYEHSGSSDCVSKLKDNLKGIYEVEFPVIKTGINKVTFTIEKDHIGVLPEGVVAMASLAKVVSPNDYTLIIDMGHVTTDLIICKGMNMLGYSVVSSIFAGGTLLKLIGSIVRNYGSISNDELSIETIKTNKVRVGKKEFNVSEDVQRAKKQFVSNYIKGEILNQIELTGISAASIQNIVPIGAVLGIKNPDNGSHDILDMIVSECVLNNAEVHILDEDLRYVNIRKASEFCAKFAKQVM